MGTITRDRSSGRKPKPRFDGPMSPSYSKRSTALLKRATENGQGKTSVKITKRNERTMLTLKNYETPNPRRASCVPEKPIRRVSFADQKTVTIFKRIPRKCARDVWFTAVEMGRFRMNVLNSNDLRFKVKLKSARCHNHMRRVLLEHRTSKGDIANQALTTSIYYENNVRRICTVSMKSSEKPREAAIETANKLEQEIVEQSLINRRVSSACFGFSHRWVFDYYLGQMVDNMCTVM